MSLSARTRRPVALLQGVAAAVVVVALVVLGGPVGVAAPPTTTAPSTSASTSGGAPKKLLVLGDSVLAGIPAAGQLPALRAALPGWQVTFDAVECRSIEGARKACGDKPGMVDGGVEALQEHGTAFDAVVIQLGTNDAADPTSALQTIAAAKTILAQLRNVPHVYWLTIREAGHYAAGYTAFNAALRALPASVPNLTVVDWAAATAKRPELFGGDGLHLANAGAREAVAVIAGAVNGELPSTVPTVAPGTSAVPSTAAASASGASGSSTPVPNTATGDVSSQSDSTTNIVIGIVVALVLIAGIVIAVLAGRRRERKHRREERTARVEAELARTAAHHGEADGDEAAPDEVALAAPEAQEPGAGEEPSPEAPAAGPPA